VKPFIFINTRFEDDYGLNTANFVSAGGAPRPPKWLLQIFPNDTPEGLLSKHREAYRYITDNGLRVNEKEKEEIRHRFLEGINKQRAYIKKMFLWPAALLIRTITHSGEKYCRTIKEQYPDGIPRI
jgi:hypothetical protein